MAIINDSKTFIPVLYDSTNSTVNGTDNTNPPSNGLTEATSTTRAAFSSFTTANSTTRFYYRFDCSSIPQNATINSVTCDFKATCSRNYFNTRIGQLCYGTTKKGTAVTITNTSINNTVNVQTITNGGSWTREELDNIGIVIEAIRGTSTNEFTLSFYGATLTVNYSYNDVTYQITSISNTDLVDSIEPEGITLVGEGGTYTLNIYANTMSNVVVEDNGSDVTNQLVQKEKSNTGSTSTVLGTYTLISGGFNGSGASYFQGLVGKGVDGSQTTSNYYSSGSGTITVFTYNLSFSNIPSNATITRLYVEVNGHAESTSNSNEYMCVRLRSGDTDLSNELNFKSIGTSNSTQTIEATTLPTVAQLENLVLYCRLGYYGGAINGATCYIEYTLPSTSEYYWEYTLSNVSADHTIYVTEAVIIPPDEDPTKEYYPITISSINATTTPGRGTTRVESGTSETITITPSDPQLTLALDNGVDITSQLVYHGGQQPTYTVAQAPNASYGFALNANNFYESGNKATSQTVAVARISFSLPRASLVTLKYINYAEATYDYGMFGNIDVALDTVNHEEGTNGVNNATNLRVLLSTSEDNSPDEKTLTYEVPAGNHFIEAKFSKDQYTDSNNDSLQFKVDSIQELTPSNYYTYDLTNISQEHSLIFIFGDVTYYFVNSSTNSDCTLYPNGQMVQLPGDSYRLTIVPKNSTDTITLRDNNVDITNQIERKEITTEKDGQTITVVNYIYRLSDIQATHDLVVSSALQQLSSSIRLNNQWNEGEIKRKQDSRWGTLSYTRIWVHNGNSWVENAQRTITTNGMIFGGVINGGGE